MATDNFVRFFGPQVITTGMPANQCLLKTGVQPIYQVCQPTKLFIRPIAGDIDTTPFAGAGGVVPQYGSAAQDLLDPHPCFSGARTGITFEGPFLRYTVAQMFTGMLKGRHSNGAIEYFFDLVGDRMLYLPFPGSVDIVGQYPGTWTFDTYAMDGESMPDGMVTAQPTALDCNATLSMRIDMNNNATPATRVFKAIPPGCHSFTANTDSMGTGGVFPTMEFYQESTPIRTGGAGTLILDTGVPLVMYGGVTSAFGNRIGQNNAWGAQFASGVNDAVGIIQWHIAYT